MDLRSLRYFVAVADEGHVGRAAERLHMTQPPLSRVIRRLEDEFGATLFERTPRGVTLTAAGSALADEARSLLAHAELVPSRVRAAAGSPTLDVGTLADSATLLGGRLVAAFRETHADASVTVHEADLGNPAAGLRTGAVDVALTRTPFDTTGLVLHVLRSEPVGVVLRDDDPLASRDSVALAELADRSWVRLPDDADEAWRDYWTLPGRPGDVRAIAVRTIQECVQAVLWNGATALAPLDQPLPDGLVTIPVDRPPSRLVIAWRRDHAGPLVREFVRTAAEVYRS